MSTLTTNIDTSAPEARQRVAAHAALVDELRAKTAAAALGGSVASHERHTSRGKLLPRDCVARLLDEHSPFLERADAVILDLEDGVSPANRPAAREALVAIPLDPSRVIVRLNAVGTDDFELDLLALARTPYRTVMLPKCERPSDIDAVGDRIVIAHCETARGVRAADHIAEHPSTAALMWGAEDLTVSTGGTSSRHGDGRYRDLSVHARARVLLAAAAADRAAIDAVHVQLDDLDGLAAEASDACAQGFRATACAPGAGGRGARGVPSDPGRTRMGGQGSRGSGRRGRCETARWGHDRCPAHSASAGGTESVGANE